MSVTQRNLERRIYGDNGKLYRIKDGNRILFAGCEVQLQIWLDTIYVPTLGSTNCKVKNTRVLLALYGDITFTKHVDSSVLDGLPLFELSAELQHTDGTTETFCFYDIHPIEIDLNSEEWLFEVPADKNMLRRLLNL